MSEKETSLLDQFRTFKQLQEYIAIGRVEPWGRGAFREFAKEHPKEAACLRQGRRAGNFAVITGLFGALGSAAYTYRYGRSGIGATLAAGAGFATAALLGGHAAMLYYWGVAPEMEPLDASIVFLRWVKDHQSA
ncbi:hypothetical protein CCYA_CCYA04G1206 [Cyanidiococcus yangmingshanensis]|uniref:Uncharacterized protein n=1 Tax=Cyanidiococcus yangmingshanensis TaxID=2690220 RepID=A0A7J7IMB7_9RHOD|nr:hypothetical protein F1559_004387 [Cyanidiococcus yangmingshanensis]KAK4530349.1 hypothetical protein CCYA_CCYA04G1206 [Cyanidiococcus yangmingshanensis]